jgi:hypothetical protein
LERKIGVAEMRLSSVEKEHLLTKKKYEEMERKVRNDYERAEEKRRSIEEIRFEGREKHDMMFRSARSLDDLERRIQCIEKVCFYSSFSLSPYCFSICDYYLPFILLLPRFFLKPPTLIAATPSPLSWTI